MTEPDPIGEPSGEAPPPADVAAADAVQSTGPAAIDGDGSGETPSDRRDGRGDWPDGLVSARKALELGLPGWPTPGETPPPPPAPVPAGRGGAQRIPRPYTARLGGPAPWADLPPAARRPSLSDVRRVLATAGDALPAGNEVRRAVASGTGRPAAVLAPLYEEDGEAVVVLTRRTWALSSHQGEVSFPGGRVEPDETPVEAALREAKEEVDLDPGLVEIVGELDHLNTLSSGAHIVPFVGLLPGRPELDPNPGEVEAVLHVRLAELADPAVYREEIWPFPNGYERRLHFFELVGDTVWGMTAALLRQLLGMLTGTLGRGDLGHP
ncbi:MAG TPA: CoA pyrophosphatase [Acidimicrobiales bacterium]